MFDNYLISAEELKANSKVPLLTVDSPYDMFVEFAAQMISEIVENNKKNKKTVFILPCGPIGQYPVFAKFVNHLKIDLKNTYIIHMDEYIMDDGNLISDTDIFSFKRCMNENFYSLIDSDLVMTPEQRIYPNPENLKEIPELIEKLGGVDIAFGGVALNGHIAFNEPQPELSVDEFSKLPTRIVTLTPETRIKDAILSRGGAVDTVPKNAITIGMKEILGARKLRLSMTLDMQRAVVRTVCTGDVTSACPASLMQNHPDAMLIVTKNVVEKPYNI